jgi:ATP-dependent Clp protease ATP-binding subunit ClpX
LFDLEDIKLEVEGEVLDFIVDRAMEFRLGARGLRSIVEAILMDAMFTLPTAEPKSSIFKLTIDYATQQFNKSNISRLKAVS